ncbi:MAG TPA: alpha/beta hydrolase [Verrucomicrobiota bacterium]|nr:alpha/beta hydrolase [Verrucomicrobiota bacterium]
MSWRRVLWLTLWGGLGLLLLLVLLGTGLWRYFHPPVTRTDGLEYGRRHGETLRLDVLRPARPNGLAVVFLVSGGWKSAPAGSLPVWMAAPLLRRGYTVFAVYHVSQPEATVGEIFEDVSRGVRFVRTHAAEFGVDPDRLGVTGASAGGHLSLLLATRGGPGPAEALAAVGRASSAVQAVAIFFPVTDLLNLGRSTENAGDGGPPKSYVRAFGPDATNLPAWRIIGRDLSPIYHIPTNLPPVLILQGTADTLTPAEQSEWFQARARELGRQVEIRHVRGGGHGWLTMFWDLRQFADWFDAHLRRDQSSARTGRE